MRGAGRAAHGEVSRRDVAVDGVGDVSAPAREERGVSVLATEADAAFALLDGNEHAKPVHGCNLGIEDGVGLDGPEDPWIEDLRAHVPHAAKMLRMKTLMA